MPLIPQRQNLDLSTSSEVARAVLDTGGLTKAEVREAWGLGEEEYRELQRRGLRGPRFGGTETCVVIDCEDNYRGDRPPMGYESFRRVWYGKRSG
jgi:hypothetical protein